MAYIVFDISISNQIDLSELEKVKKDLPNKFKNLEFKTETNHLKDILLDDYYMDDEYDDVKELSEKLSKVILKGEIKILITECDDEYGFLITPNETEMLTRNCEWIKV